MGPTNGLKLCAVALTLALASMAPGTVNAQSSSTSQCTAPANGNCTLTFNITDGATLTGSFTTQLPATFCVYYVPSPSECVQGGSGAYVTSGTFAINSTNTGYGNYVFKFDNSRNGAANVVTLSYTHTVKGSTGVGLADIPDFPPSMLAAIATAALVAIAYLLVGARKTEES